MSNSVAHSGLYYPHTTAVDSSVLKTALLLWDELQFIVPHEEFKLRSETNDRLVDEAYDLIGKAHVPTFTEKQQVHEQVEEILTTPNSQQFLTQRDDTLAGQYEIYPQKLLEETWHMLHQSELAEQNGSTVYFPSFGLFQDMVTSQKIGLLLMLYLAQACGGATRRLITDRTSSYTTLNQALAATTPDNQAAIGDCERIVTRSIKIVDVNRISLENLIKLRKAESESDGHHLRKMRHKYLAMIDQFSVELTNAAEVDMPELERRQDQDMKDNLAELRDALKMAASDAIHEKEVFVAMVAAAGMTVAPITIPAGITSIIALNKTRLKYKEARRKAMTEHAMSWLFQAAHHGQFTAY